MMVLSSRCCFFNFLGIQCGRKRKPSNLQWWLYIVSSVIYNQSELVCSKSNVATCWGCGGNFICGCWKFVFFPAVKELWKLNKVWRVTAASFVACFLLCHSRLCVLTLGFLVGLCEWIFSLEWIRLCRCVWSEKCVRCCQHFRHCIMHRVVTV